MHKQGLAVDPLCDWQQQKPMVYAGLFPYESLSFPKLEESIRKVKHLIDNVERS